MRQERGRGGPFGGNEPWSFMKCLTPMYPGQSGLFEWQRWDGSAFFAAGEYDYVFDAGYENCILNGEIIPVRFNFERGRLEPVGSRGLVRNLSIDQDLENNQAGYAYVLDRTGQKVTTALVRFKNLFAKEFKKNDKVACRYHYSGGDGQPNYWIQLVGEAGGVQKRWYKTTQSGIPKATADDTPHFELCQRMTFNGTQIVSYSTPPTYDPVGNGSSHNAVGQNKYVQCCFIDGAWFVDVEYCTDGGGSDPIP